MNRLYVILMALNTLAIGMLLGVWSTDYRLEQGCEKEMLYTTSWGNEFTCLKVPDVVIKTNRGEAK